MTSDPRTPEPDLRRDLHELLQIADASDFAEVSRRGLDWLSGVAPYDLATLFLLDAAGEELVAHAARGPLAQERIAHHRLSLSRYPSIRESLDLRRARIFTEHDHAHGEGDPYDDVLDLPHGHACMVVPLCAADSIIGLVTLDRQVCEPYPQSTLALVELYGQLFAVALDRTRRLNDLRDLRAREGEARESDGMRVVDPARILETSREARVQELTRRARAVAATETPVLILGETGTGKEQLARALHAWSPRSEQPFVALNCAAVPPELIESELFGHVKGAFTGASGKRQGRFQTAKGGTLLLDEIGELSADLQVKLLRVLQEGRFSPVGADEEIEADARVLAATNIDLEQAIGDGRFREDLFYRLNVFPLELPPLRERNEDFDEICQSILDDVCRRTGRAPRKLSSGGLAKLRQHTWPGNLRELSNVLERALILSLDAVLDADVLDLPRRVAAANTRPDANADDEDSGLLTLAEVERNHIERALRRTAGKVYGTDGAAAILGLKPSTLQSRIKKHGIGRSSA